jgi:hypothetical protein
MSRQSVSRALAEAWQWLQTEGLIMPAPDQPNSYFATRRGERLKNDADVEAYKKRGMLPRENLQPVLLEKVRPMFSVFSRASSSALANAPDHSNVAVKDYSDHFHCCPQRLEGISDRPFRLAYCADRPTFVRPSRGLRLNPIESVKAAIKSMDFLNRAIRPFGLYLPVFAVF